MFDWEDWSNNKLSKEQRDQVLLYLSDVQKRNPEIFKLPVHLDERQIRDWQIIFVQKLEQEMNHILKGEIQTVPTIDTENRKLAYELIEKSKKWISKNLWPTP